MKKIKQIGKQLYNQEYIADDDARTKPVIPRAIDLAFVTCHCCGLLNTQTNQMDQHQYCSRCRTALHVRKDHSQSRTLALVIAATILYIPANLLPMTITDSLLGHQQDTIMSGVIYFWQSGDYFVAAVIFTASIFIPMVKLLILYFLVFMVRMQSSAQWNMLPSHCSVLYRIVEFVGRWSMIDVFVVALLTALIQIQSLATILAGPGAVAFGAVVVLTMFASLSFDPRIIWDNYYASQNRLQKQPNSTKKTMINQINHLPSKNDFFQPR
ncbi:MULTISPECIES: paraquat-inducible protein A [unclassified Acinetobacter]|uniref:paraquat-inducible protein A n=1 Tax=unclassified Acinetobacter TaxID=196816 RepID=UPI00190C4291|nr:MULTISPECIES: paraquat-inducible protein A [unclassified Acinetobacter]MBK0063138.1 paraquat-inducible protein A [Acinetobacter sp. S55]MBK0066444.1 paraquat-inducible protein A [Acinetobacter sp. S54]